MPIIPFLLVLLLAPAPATAQSKPLPIIDMHLHALKANSQGPSPVMIGAPYNYWPERDTRRPEPEYFMAFSSEGPHTKRALRSPMTNEEMKEKTIAVLKRRNIIAVTSGTSSVIESWHRATRSGLYSR